ncbi:hydroxymethylglutaryl-CoA lyase [Evansella caseinilytica]|uniref:Hydroxymethylglutaryl-CoA lyase n=1 Tax=Evansella caseinilytica TaxID=1503961 RepID=A0A1H3QR76_9BACI|nr:hydroxymethylglutaryl-CoA lyase [Evansella caseinilytica]SDZ15793.1 hydroxymethylglutaryl-CoA lyase [Evansella caseinilytica]
MDVPERVTVKEVGPRDGLQNTAGTVPTATKIAWINQLGKTGVSYIEITAFVHPKWLPALSDGAEVACRIQREPGVTYAALVPNVTGLARALEANVDEVAVFMSASETHNRKNINKSLKETYPVLDEVIRTAAATGKKVRGYVSTVFGCPYEGEISVERVKAVTDRLLTMGVYEVSLGDTIGIADPRQTNEVLTELTRDFSTEQLALHFHDTRGMALANTIVGLTHGITTFDSAAGGLGGCPYAKGATGNVATEDLLYMLEKMGVSTGIDFSRFIEAAAYIDDIVQQPLPSRQLSMYFREQEEKRQGRS